jgi:hypothetical protein
MDASGDIGNSEQNRARCAADAVGAYRVMSAKQKDLEDHVRVV